jgi:hypothetical protein
MAAGPAGADNDVGAGIRPSVPAVPSGRPG